MTKELYEENMKAVLKTQQELILAARTTEEQQNAVKACAMTIECLTAAYMANL